MHNLWPDLCLAEPDHFEAERPLQACAGDPRAKASAQITPTQRQRLSFWLSSIVARTASRRPKGLLKRALLNQEKAYGKNHGYVAMILDQLAEAYIGQNRYDEAKR